MTRADLPAAVEPSPGSPEAVARGCSCPVLDNGHGRGAWGDGKRYGWWMSADCPLHGEARKAVGEVAAEREGRS